MLGTVGYSVAHLQYAQKVEDFVAPILQDFELFGWVHLIFNKIKTKVVKLHNAYYNIKI